MSAPMTARTRRIATLALTAFCLLACWFYRGTSTSDKVDDRMVFGMTVEAPNGDLLASPVVMGDPGQTVEVHLVCEEDPRAERMSLTLQPMGVANGNLLYSYDLSVAGHVKNQKGTVQLTPGKERRISVQPDEPGGVTLALFAAPVKHPNLGRYLQNRKLHHRPAAT